MTTAHSRTDDLACDCPPVLPLLAGALLGLAATAGWVGVVAWQVARRPESWAWVRSVR